jgi:hypothetical protein
MVAIKYATMTKKEYNKYMSPNDRNEVVLDWSMQSQLVTGNINLKQYQYHYFIFIFIFYIYLRFRSKKYNNKRFSNKLRSY